MTVNVGVGAAVAVLVDVVVSVGVGVSVPVGVAVNVAVGVGVLVGTLVGAANIVVCSVYITGMPSSIAVASTALVITVPGGVLLKLCTSSCK